MDWFSAAYQMDKILVQVDVNLKGRMTLAGI